MRYPQIFRVLTNCQRDPWVLGCHRAFGMRVLKIRERRANLLLLAQGKSRGLLLYKDFKGQGCDYQGQDYGQSS